MTRTILYILLLLFGAACTALMDDVDTSSQPSDADTDTDSDSDSDTDSDTDIDFDTDSDTSPDCAPGDHQCNDTVLEICELTDRLPEWSTVTHCSGDTPVCNATAARCDCIDADVPTCESNITRICVTGQWHQTTCTDGTPVCIEGTGCAPCTEHHHCTQSACHLSGPKNGSCFDTSRVVRVDGIASLQTALKTLSDGDEAVYRLAAGRFEPTEFLEIPADTEVAIIGMNGTVIVGGPSTGSANQPLITARGTTYFATIEMREPTSPMTGILAQQTGEVWLDDVFITQFNQPLRSLSKSHVRRSMLQAENGTSIYANGGTLSVQNTVLGSVSGTAASNNALVTNNAVIDVRYSTIIGGNTTVSCLSVAPTATSGAIRNSIIMRLPGGQDEIDERCAAVHLSGNAGIGVSYQRLWFVDPDNGDFHLSSIGATAAGRTAQWEPGDPLYDIDGDARPQTSPGYPGIDEP